MQRPRVAVTFALLRLSHALSIQGHLNIYDFYRGLARITDGDPMPVRALQVLPLLIADDRITEQLPSF